MENGVITGLREGDLDLAATLNSGQMFRWWRDADGAFVGTVGRRRLRLSQSDDGGRVHYAADGPEADAFVRSFLRLDDIDLPAHAERWCRADSLFAEAWAAQPGVRIVRQDPEECFFSFLCASVAPIRRISGMLTAVVNECGTKLPDGYHAFPHAAELACVTEDRLRELGLGFRARRIAEAAKQLAELPPDWLPSLRARSHPDAREALCQFFFGLGWKIADCICLFSLDKDDAIPVDTHILRIAQTRYTPELAGKSLTPAHYERITAAFRERFGERAGWAQQILFYRAAVGSRRENRG
ncbi:MAG: DNA glycosylase [Capsulimonadales bacterium]|nr:DNA glycosylase [Capsulimonadales bacterium]